MMWLELAKRGTSQASISRREVVQGKVGLESGAEAEPLQEEAPGLLRPMVCLVMVKKACGMSGDG